MKRLLIANRGEIVSRIARTARAMGIATIGIFSDPDAGSPAMAEVDVSARLPGATAADTYLNQEAVLEAARRSGADAIHPGFGFLAENAGFAAAVIGAGLIWVGPDPEHMAAMGDKLRARRLAEEAGLPVLPAAGEDDPGAVGYPLMVKAAAGGGGKGMRLVAAPEELEAAAAQAAGEAERSFGDATLYLEKFVSPARHVEVQVFGDGAGGAVHLHERECSIQRRHQKIIEEAPSPGIDDELRQRLCESAAALTHHLGYRGAGTVEYVVGEDGHWFIEMNTRLQVEHPVTEEVTGLDLVEWQLRVASGQGLPLDQEQIEVTGHAIEARLYAEDPSAGWAPAAGPVHHYRHRGNARYEDAIGEGAEITAYYDSMIAKVVSAAPNREEAATKLAAELAAIEFHGPATNRDFLVAALRSDDFGSGRTFTSFVDDHPELLDPLPELEARSHLAAAMWHRVRSNRATDSHWGFAPAGWRNVRSQWSDVSFDGSIVSYRMTGDTIEFRRGDGEPATAVVTGNCPYAIEIEGLTRRCRVKVAGGAIWVNSAEGQSRFVPDPRFPVHDTLIAGGGPSAPMPGTVIEVLVAAGDHVDEHTDLLVMEAMKMEHRIRPPGPARVVAVLVAAGDQVEAGRLLVRLEEEEEA